MNSGSGGDAGRLRFDPVTYLDEVVAEVPDYLALQDATVAATVGPRVDRVLELGVGTGETSVRVLGVHPAAELTGIDESGEMLAVARAVVPAADLRVGRLEDRLPTGRFDLVVSVLAIHHLGGGAKADLFRRVADRLGSGGRFVIGDLVVPADPTDSVTPIDGLHDTPSSVPDQLCWLAEAGLEPAVAWVQRDLAVLVGVASSGGSGESVTRHEGTDPRS